MKRAIFFTLGIGLLLALPAIPQDGDEEGLDKQVEALTQMVMEQQEQLKQLQAYVETQQQEAAALLKELKKAEKEGFTYPAPHTGAKKALLHGLLRFADKTAGAKAKADEEE